jgi:transaldolase
MPLDGGDAKQILDAYAGVGIDHMLLAAKLQSDGAESFDTSWKSLLASIAARHHELAATGS